jgi:hypothetical protein
MAKTTIVPARKAEPLKATVRINGMTKEQAIAAATKR